jgi:Protein of Unknown function (DUF2784)
MAPATYRVLADMVLIFHVVYISFVICGLLLILVGGVRDWRWIRNPWFRALHLFAIVLVVVQAWLGIICPLTTLEMHLREQAGDWVYHETFIAHWLARLIFYRAPMWAFGLGYTLFALAVIGSWWRFPPQRKK